MCYSASSKDLNIHRHAPEQEDDDSHGVHSLFEYINDSINVTHNETGGNSESRELTITVFEVPKPSSTEDNTMESDNFVEITTEMSYNGEYKAGFYLLGEAGGSFPPPTAQLPPPNCLPVIVHII